MKEKMRFERILITLQSIYILLTALWPILHIESFMDVTGPKTDVWLVKTVGALLLPIAVALLYQLTQPRSLTAILLGGLSAIAFVVIDFYYALSGTISDVYLTDGIVQLVFLLGWMVVAMLNSRAPKGKSQRNGYV